MKNVYVYSTSNFFDSWLQQSSLYSGLVIKVNYVTLHMFTNKKSMQLITMPGVNIQ